VLEVPEALSTGEGMEDGLYNENGLTYFPMAYMNGTAQGDQVHTELYLRVSEIDLQTGEEKSKEFIREPLDIPLEAPLAQQIYMPAEPFAPDGYVLESVRAELAPAGLYVYAAFTAPEGAKPDDVHEKWGNEETAWLDSQGQRYPTGVNLSSYLNTENFPAVVYEDMLPLGELPEKMILQIGGRQVEVTR